MDMTSPLFDPQFLAQYRAMMEPPQEAKKQAGMDSLLALGLGLLANRGPHLGPAIGNAGFAAMGTYKSGLDAARQNRMGEIQGAMGLRKLQKEMEQEQRRKELVGQISDPTERLYFEADPEAYVKAKVEGMFPKQEPYTLGPGQKRYDKAGNVLSEVPATDAESKISRLWAEYEAAPVGHPKRQILMDAIRKESSHAPGASVSVGLQSPIMLQNADGGYSFIQPANKPGFEPQITNLPSGMKPAAEVKPPTADQANAAGFLLRMQEAEKVLSNLTDKGESGKPSGGEIVARNLPFVGGPIASNAAASPSRQLYRQAQEDWVRAKLRKESGAIIGVDEMVQEIETYFPQPFDPPALIEQKRRARKTAERALGIATGNAAPKSEGGASIQDAARAELERRRGAK